MPALRVAFYARVSSDQQTEQGTIASQVAALEARILQDGLPLEPDHRFIDEGHSGATLIRPALEHLRDAVAAGTVDRVYVHSPDRLARRYAYQVLLIDEFRRLGVEIMFLNRAIGLSPEDDLLLQVQGMVAEYERAKILERSRRGKRHAAHQGRISVLSGAPYGYRYIGKHEGGGIARYAIDEAEAPTVRLMFQWIGHDRISIGEVCRRLRQHGYLTRSGKPAWDRATVWGILKNPAYIGTAAFGKTRIGAMRERLRPVRGGAEQPRWPYSTYDVPEQEWLRMPVPALIESDLFTAVQEQLAENRRRNRQTRRGQRYLLQGLLVCRRCLLRQGDQPAGGKGQAARLCLLPLLRQRCPSLWRAAPVRQSATADRSRRCSGLAGSAAAPPEPRHDRGRVRTAPAPGPTSGSRSSGSRHRRSADRKAAPRHRPAP